MENILYKHADYEIRSQDPDALAKYRIVLSWLPDTDGLRVLNSGCGTGEMTALLSENRSWQVDAITQSKLIIPVSQTSFPALSRPFVQFRVTMPADTPTL
jgi:cyclopropane fatty-acyl-phospholipid synthase-like methyltransferase